MLSDIMQYVKIYDLRGGKMQLLTTYNVSITGLYLVGKMTLKWRESPYIQTFLPPVYNDSHYKDRTAGMLSYSYNGYSGRTEIISL